MGEMKKVYNQGNQLLENKQYQLASELFMKVRKRDRKYLSVNHKLARCFFGMKEYQKSIYYERNHLRVNHRSNQCQANLLLYRAYLKLKMPLKAAFYLETAHELGLADEMYDIKKQRVEKELAKRADDKETKRELYQRDIDYLTKVKFRYKDLATSGSPIAVSNMPQDQGLKFFINGMNDAELTKFSQSKGWQHLAVSKPEITKIPFYRSVKMSDERTLYKYYLPKMDDIAQIKAFNDYLEDNPFFKKKWADSKVFSLLLIEGFTPEVIEHLLELNSLLTKQEFTDLQTCDDLVFLKEEGELLPLDRKNEISNRKLLTDFNQLCFENCGNTLHLRSKCVAERQLLRRLKQVDGVGLPLVKENKTFKPTAEQQDFIDWLQHQRHNVISLLGVGGSGKTYTMGQMLDTKKVYALAPTHKARLNLGKFFKETATVQRVIADIERGRSMYYRDSDVILIDEVSMLPLEMLVKILNYFGGKKVILIGDDKQLPPVSKDTDAFEVVGNVMELLQEGQVYYFRDNIRCKDEETGQFIKASRNKDTYTLNKLNYRHESLEEMLAYKAKYPSIEDCMILAYRNQTVGKINQSMYEKLSVNDPHRVEFNYEKNRGLGGFFVGAQVVFYENDRYNNGYTNSEFGIVEEIYTKLDEDRRERKWIRVRTNQDCYDLPLGIAYRDLRLAYAITIHKAQGSGAKKVYVLESEDYGLAYTAVSRAKEQLVFVNLEEEEFLESLQKPAPKKKNVQLLENNLLRKRYLVVLNQEQWQNASQDIICNYVYNLDKDALIYLYLSSRFEQRIVGIARYVDEFYEGGITRKIKLRLVKKLPQATDLSKDRLINEGILLTNGKLLNSSQIEYLQKITDGIVVVS